MAVKYNDLALATTFSDGSYDNEAYVCIETGVFHYKSDCVDEPLPDDIYDDTKYLLVPSQKELDLGQTLIFDFINEHYPSHYDKVRKIFRARGAYRYYKEFLMDIDALDQWHQYEDKAEKEVLIEWCKEHGLELEGL